jgi:2,4-diaminopentanoate dehydrogenase
VEKGDIVSDRIRVAQCYTGGVGSEIVRRLAVHPRMELVGVLVHSEDKDGRDAGELAGIPPVGVTATRKLDDIIALKPDAAVWSGQGWEPEKLARLLEAGINVYTGFGGYYLKGQPEQGLLATACERGGSSFAAGGNIPGLISDVLPLFLSGYSGAIRHITAWQRNHVEYYPSALQLTAGLGLGRPLEAESGADEEAERHLDGHWEWLIGMSAAMVADGLHIPYTRITTRTKEKAAAPRTETLPGSGLVIEAGTLGGVRWTWDAYSDDRLFLTVINEQTGVYGLGEGWRSDEAAPAWTVTIDGSPPIVATMTWPAGTPAASANAKLNAAHAINFLPALVAAPAGLRSVLDLPLITCSDVTS